MLRVYRDRNRGIWIELREGYVTYIGETSKDVKISEGTLGLSYLTVSNEWSLEEADATYELWELS